MVKKISVVALAGLIMLPSLASASTSDLEKKIEELSRQLNVFTMTCARELFVAILHRANV